MSDGTDRGKLICEKMRSFWEKEKCEIGTFMTKSQCDLCMEICMGHVNPPCIDHG